MPTRETKESTPGDVEKDDVIIKNILKPYLKCTTIVKLVKYFRIEKRCDLCPVLFDELAVEEIMKCIFCVCVETMT